MANPSDPDWWVQALKLEQQDKLTQAEATIRKVLDPRGDPSSAQIAHLYELRCRRLIMQGDFKAARAAAEKGYALMLEYASGATSGGEGVALSQEAEDYRKSLERLFQKSTEATQ